MSNEFLPEITLQAKMEAHPNLDAFRDELIGRGVETSEELAKHMIDKIQVATLPGTVFCDAPENLTLRLATCVFDRQIALNYYIDFPDCLSESLVHACCPDIKFACLRIREYFDLLIT